MKKYIFVLVVLFCGCGPSCEYKPDQVKRNEAFFKCMKSLPVGPVSVKYNDWDEVVSECGAQAYYLSLTEVCK